jgi:hypothetical protein
MEIADTKCKELADLLLLVLVALEEILNVKALLADSSLKSSKRGVISLKSVA